MADYNLPHYELMVENLITTIINHELVAPLSTLKAESLESIVQVHAQSSEVSLHLQRGIAKGLVVHQ